MKRFRFRLEKVLALRVREEDLVKNEFKTALNDVRLAEADLSRVLRRIAEGAELIRAERSRAALDIRRLLLLEEGQRRVALLEEPARNRLKAAERRAEQVRKRLEEARRDRRRLESVETKHRRRHEADARAEEQRGLDEVAVTRFMRRA